MRIAWFSAGVSSAVACQLCTDIDRIIYIHIDDQHQDTMRFVKDCAEWLDREIEIIQSPLKSVENACLQRAYINGVAGASCTRMLKKRLRKQYEREEFSSDLEYVWGMDSEEGHRAERLIEYNPGQKHIFPLIEQAISKSEAHGILERAGIKRPAMYDLGYQNNNCIGCVKGGMGYWNKVRVDFPEVFESRSKLERRIGASCINGVFLDELEPTRGRMQKEVMPDCGIFCMATNLSGGEKA